MVTNVVLLSATRIYIQDLSPPASCVVTLHSELTAVPSWDARNKKGPLSLTAVTVGVERGARVFRCTVGVDQFLCGLVGSPRMVGEVLGVWYDVEDASTPKSYPMV